jgi:hypothetical protein
VSDGQEEQSRFQNRLQNIWLGAAMLLAESPPQMAVRTPGISNQGS